MDVFGRHRDVLRERPLVRHPQHLRAAQPNALVGAPAQRRIDHDARPDRRALGAHAVRGHGPHAVGAGNARQLDPRIQTLADEDVAPVERRARDLDQRLPRPGSRIVDVLDAEVLGTVLTVDLVESDGAHPAGVRVTHRERLPKIVKGKGGWRGFGLSVSELGATDRQTVVAARRSDRGEPLSQLLRRAVHAGVSDRDRRPAVHRPHRDRRPGRQRPHDHGCQPGRSELRARLPDRPAVRGSLRLQCRREPDPDRRPAALRDRLGDPRERRALLGRQRRRGSASR